MANPNNEIETHILLEEGEIAQLRAIEDYWTPERMAEAIPITVDLTEDQVALLLESFEIEGDALMIASTPPDGIGGQHELDQELSDDLAYSTTRVGNRSVLPYCTVGKLYMRFGGSNYVGTAWSIARRGVFTAGHCVFDRSGGGWANSVKFVPQFHQGAQPLGSWVATRLHSLVGWTKNGDFKYDMGVMEVDRPIGPRTGTLGWMANYPPNQGPYTSIGYPAAGQFDGQEMWQSVGKYINGSNPVQMHNNMTGGCSGGPWAVTRGAEVYANGLNSFRYTSNPNTMYSPYFGQGFINLYNLVKNLI